jgi:predicted GNAT family acetyltransferase
VDTELAVQDNKESRSYDALLDGKVVGSVIYEHASPQRIVFRSTIVDPQMRGHGIGSKLVKAALDDVRAQGLTVTAYCSFVERYFAEHPEYADLVDPTFPGHPRR